MDNNALLAYMHTARNTCCLGMWEEHILLTCVKVVSAKVCCKGIWDTCEAT